MTPEAQETHRLHARVFLAEDDGDHILLLRRALQRYPQPIDLTVARDGQQAIEMLSTGDRPDLILLDINMPRRTGLEVLQVIRDTGRLGQRLGAVPTVILTTSTREEDRRASLSLGADAFVTKPTSFREFTDALYGLLDVHLVPASAH